MTLRTTSAKGVWPAILKAGLLAGTLDILSAIVKYLIEGKKNPEVILKYIATAVLGKTAMKGGWDVAALGLLLHYIIAFIFTILLFWLYPRLKLVRFHPLVVGIFYGIFTWLVMNLLVVPISRVPGASGSFNWPQTIINVLILIAFIGIPVSLMARKYYLYKK